MLATPAGARPGDKYVITDNANQSLIGNVYDRTATGWTLHGNIRGATGPMGPGAAPNFSTSEHLTGANWIDGRPIYRRAWAGAVNIQASTAPVFTVGAGVTFVRASSLVNAGGGNWTGQYMEPASGGNYHLGVSPAAGTVYLYGNLGATSATIIVEYCKP